MCLDHQTRNETLMSFPPTDPQFLFHCYRRKKNSFETIKLFHKEEESHFFFRLSSFSNLLAPNNERWPLQLLGLVPLLQSFKV